MVLYTKYCFSSFSGIWLHESGVLGASPDGLVTQAPVAIPVHWNDPDGPRLSPQILEVKCPFSAREYHIHEAVHKAKGFFLGKYKQLGSKKYVKISLQIYSLIVNISSITINNNCPFF